MSDAEHWNAIYAGKPTEKVGWYKPHLTTSLRWIASLELERETAIIDVGGGASTLVDDLLVAGFQNITFLDLSEKAIALTQNRLGNAADSITWLQGDVTRAELPARHFHLWHDRAVFHFLIDPASLDQYKTVLLNALATGGHFIIGTFATDAPPRCSGLPVQRYTPGALSQFFGEELVLRRHRYERHVTPSGVEQPYVYCLFKRIARQT